MPSDTRAFMHAVLAQSRNAERAEFNLAAVERDSGRLVGSAALQVTSREHARGELGYVFHREVWSRGYATEAGRLLLRFGFESLRLRRISATCRPENVASARVLVKIGMRYKGTLRSSFGAPGETRCSTRPSARPPASESHERVGGSGTLAWARSSSAGVGT
ncbi:GNAT family N-acetyltransferase [Amycolatopsis pigmentata]|uniref:GNAT family N-acetyltransferase n=1 Tax=Amycolatopsis pigmentata TaxID=450801 RepID=A0ABW5FXC5_9PSEU